MRRSRAAFLRDAAAAILGVLAVPNTLSCAETQPKPRSKGRQNSKVKRWDIITIGNLSRNRYWGESDSKGVRSAICTCTVVQGEGFCLIVDPSLTNAEEMARELDRRTGLKPRDVTAAFITHEHSDHWFGLTHFPGAKWLAAPDVAAALNGTGKLPKQVEPTGGRLFDAVEVISTPGHTTSHHSLRFDSDGLSIVVAGDAVPTRDFWQERRGYYNCVDFEQSARSMEKIAGLANVVVPGHDNYFVLPDPDA